MNPSKTLPESPIFVLSSFKLFLVNKHMPRGYKLETMYNLKKKNYTEKLDGIPLLPELEMKRKIDSTGLPLKEINTRNRECLNFNNDFSFGNFNNNPSRSPSYKRSELVALHPEKEIDKANFYFKSGNLCQNNFEIEGIDCTLEPKPQISYPQGKLSSIDFNKHHLAFTPYIEQEGTPVVEISPFNFDSPKQMNDWRLNPEEVQNKIKFLEQNNNIQLSNKSAIINDSNNGEKINVINNSNNNVKPKKSKQKLKRISSEKAVSSIGTDIPSEVNNSEVQMLLKEIKELKTKCSQMEREIDTLHKTKTNRKNVSNNEGTKGKKNKIFDIIHPVHNKSKKREISDEEKSDLVKKINQMSLSEKKELRFIIKDYITIYNDGQFEFNINCLPKEVFLTLKKFVEKSLNKEKGQTRISTNEIEVKEKEVEKGKGKLSPVVSTMGSEENFQPAKQNFLGVKRNFFLNDDSELSSSLDSSSSSSGLEDSDKESKNENEKGFQVHEIEEIQEELLEIDNTSFK